MKLENTSDQIISEKIKQIREANNLSQARFGRKIGLSGKSISAYETGKAAPSLKVLEKISRVYDVEFLHLKEDRKRHLTHKLCAIRDSLSELEELIKSGIPI